jgi:hypothetical protein
MDSRLEVANDAGLQFGTGDFSVAVWIHTEEKTSDVVGDIVSKFDPDARRGFSLGVVTNSGVTTTAQSNYRNVHFGIDNGRLDAAWTDCGRPGRAVQIQALRVCNNHLYAGTFEMEADECGHLWRYAGGQQWEDLGAPPDGSNAIPSVVEFEGKLHCGSGRYNPLGSALGPARNPRPGGHVYRIEDDGRWTECGQPGKEGATPDDQWVEGHETGKADEATSLTVYRGELYCTSLHRRGAFRYEGGSDWKYIGPNERLFSFTIYQGRLYALVNGGPIYRYEGGTEWTYCGKPENARQIYSGVVYGGDLYVGTWPDGALFRYEGGESWKRVATVGFEKEIMGMALYNGKVYCGSLPMANAWRLDRHGWTFVGNVDNTSTVILRRLWSMAVYRGKLFVGTLPSGRVLSLEAGRLASSDQTLAYGWRHIVAVRQGGRLRLHVDGSLASESSPFTPSDFDLNNDQPLRIGFGVGHPFQGRMSDLRIYNRALTPRESGQLATHANGN